LQYTLMRCSITEAGALADISTGFTTSGSERWATEWPRIERFPAVIYITG
jgi:hypothetical protein